jgi:hypothetical protein
MPEGRYIAYYRVARQGASGQWYPATVKNVLRREARLRRMESRAA